MPSIHWHDDEAAGYADILPPEWFVAEGEFPGRVHQVIGPRGPSEAQCDVSVSATAAELNYEAYRSFNDPRGMLPGCCGSSSPGRTGGP
ncbi:MAG TPA: hypothetical protein VKE74_16500 [Gemmataceae bacterium]|nr:hypothetical protein [Gemmataceae bacterium]